MPYLGVDQSLTSTGYVVLPDDGNVPLLMGTITSKFVGAERLAYIYDTLVNVMCRYHIVRGALEGYAINVTHRGMDLGEVGGIVRLAFCKAKIGFEVVSPSSLKKFVANNGAADKDEMMVAVHKHYGQVISQNDICDAYGLAQVARVATLHKSTRRCELEVVQTLQEVLVIKRGRKSVKDV